MPVLDIADCINKNCPWSGDPVQADSLTVYEGHVVGFCNPGCLEKFERAINQFKAAIAGIDKPAGASGASSASGAGGPGGPATSGS